MSRLEAAIAAGRLVVTSELPAIDGGGLDAVRARLEPLEPYVDALNVTDNTAAHAHASSVAVAIALVQLGVEPILQLVCRDRNRLALQADIAGAALHGVENVLCLRGDDVTAGDEPEAKPVFDLDSMELLATVASLAAGRYLSGRALDPAPRLFPGAVESPVAPFDLRVARALEKADAGARFLQLQFAFDRSSLEGFLTAAEDAGLTRRVALIPSIGLMRSPASPRSLDPHVPGVSVPADLIERCEAASDAAEECFEVACELAEHARSLPGVAGLHLISFRRDDAVARLCERLGIPPRAEREASGHGSRVTV
jgi:methylenetetrahydrofolate reductase (NADPH)